MTSRLFATIIIGALVSTTLTVTYGAKGLIACRSLQRYRDTLAENVVRLERIRGSLDEQLRAYSSSRVLVELEAREMGYVRPESAVLYVPGLVSSRDAYEVGTVVTQPSDPADFRTGFVAIGVACGAIALFLSLALKPRDRQ